MEPEILTDALPTVGDVEVDLSDLEVVTMTRGEFRAALERVKNAEWKAARKRFQSKAEKMISERLALLDAERNERVQKLEIAILTLMEGKT